MKRGFLGHMNFMTKTRLIPNKLGWFITLGPTFLKPDWRAPKLPKHVFTHLPKRELIQLRRALGYGWHESEPHRQRRSSVKEPSRGKRERSTCIKNWNQCRGFHCDSEHQLHDGPFSGIYYCNDGKLTISILFPSRHVAFTYFLQKKKKVKINNLKRSEKNPYFSTSERQDSNGQIRKYPEVWAVFPPIPDIHTVMGNQTMQCEKREGKDYNKNSLPKFTVSDSQNLVETQCTERSVVLL